MGTRNFKSYLMIGLLLAFIAILFAGCTSPELETGKLAYRNKEYEKAVTNLEKGLAINKDDSEGWYMLGHAYSLLGRYEEAANAINKSLAINDKYSQNVLALWAELINNGASNFNDGIAAEKRKDSSLTKTLYTRALNSFIGASYIIPDSIKSYKYIGETYLALNEREKAMDIFNKILEKSKSKEDAEKVAAILYDVGMGMVKIENFNAAAETFQKIMGMQYLPKDDQYWEASAYFYALSKAAIGAKMRDDNPDSDDYKQPFNEALNVLEPLSRTLVKKDIEVRVWELLVNVYASLGDNVKAQDALKKKEELEKLQNNN